MFPHNLCSCHEKFYFNRASAGRVQVVCSADCSLPGVPTVLGASLPALSVTKRLLRRDLRLYV
jgi:hypothetical protein